MLSIRGEGATDGEIWRRTLSNKQLTTWPRRVQLARRWVTFRTTALDGRRLMKYFSRKTVIMRRSTVQERSCRKRCENGEVGVEEAGSWPAYGRCSLNDHYAGHDV